MQTSYTCIPTVRKHHTAATNVGDITENTCVAILDHTNVTNGRKVSLTYVITRDTWRETIPVCPVAKEIQFGK